MSKTAVAREKEASQVMPLSQHTAIGRTATPPAFALTADPNPVQLQKKPSQEKPVDRSNRYEAAKVLSAELVKQREQKLFAALRADQKYNELMNSPGNEALKKQVYVIIANIVRIKREGVDDRLYNLFKDQFAAAFRSKQALPAKEEVKAPEESPSKDPSTPGPSGSASAKATPPAASAASKPRKYTKVTKSSVHDDKPYEFEYEVDRSNIRAMHLRVKVALKGGKGEIAKIKSQAKAIQDIYAQTKGISLELVFVPAGTKGALQVNAFKSRKNPDGTEVRERINADNWGIDPKVNAHELGHPLGLRDRYDHVFSGSRPDFKFNDRIYYLHKAVTDNQYSTDPGLMRYLSESTRLLPEEVCTITDIKGKAAFDYCVKEQKDVNK